MQKDINIMHLNFVDDLILFIDCSLTLCRTISSIYKELYKVFKFCT